ncbi:MAG: alpha/beta fold hydrolase, partial [Clostridia bacterium]|nr:alpha/beta fold hydrolase [Clostridia bacterium]
LLGHSMGSFIARKYAAQYREHIDALIVSGTSGGGGAEKAAKLLASLLCKVKGKRSRSKLLTNMVNSNNRKRFASEGPLGWLTRDPEVRKRYAEDPACTFTFTVGAYRDMFSMLCEVNEDAWFDSISLDLPVLIMSGSDDSVGGYGTGVTSVFDRLNERELCDLTFRLYEGGRHEMLNELNRDEVYADVLSFIDSVCEGVIALRTGGAF